MRPDELLEIFVLLLLMMEELQIDLLTLICFCFSSSGVCDDDSAGEGQLCL